jgi:hypothetical protein
MRLPKDINYVQYNIDQSEKMEENAEVKKLNFT